MRKIKNVKLVLMLELVIAVLYAVVFVTTFPRRK